MSPYLGFSCCCFFFKEGETTGLHDQEASGEIKVEASFTLQEELISHSLFTDLNNDALGTSQVQLILYYTCANNCVQVPRPYTLYVFSVSIQESGPATKPKPTKTTG